MKATTLLLGLIPAFACHAESSLTFSSALDYSTGKYGQKERTETFSIPFGIKYEVSDWTLRASIPYIDSIGPSNVSGVGADAITIGNGNSRRRRTSGLGDLVLSASWTAFQTGPWLLELGTKVKVATADDKSGLGTGENDYSVQAELYRTFETLSVFGTVGFKKMGDPAGVDLKDPFYASVGGAFRANPSTVLGVSYDFREKIQETSAPLRDATCFLTYKLDQNWKLQTYISKGFSRSSADFGGGVFIFFTK